MQLRGEGAAGRGGCSWEGRVQLRGEGAAEVIDDVIRNLIRI